eukprot:6187817-Pleurochrysis_carterae.AAC.4
MFMILLAARPEEHHANADGSNHTADHVAAVQAHAVKEPAPAEAHGNEDTAIDCVQPAEVI